jgi:sortase A
LKKLYIAIFSLFIIVGLLVYSTIYGYKILQNKEQSQQVLKSTFQLIQNAEPTQVDEEKEISKEDILLEDELIGILKIPKLNVQAPIKDGTSQEVMKTSIGHFTESNYWNGNVSLASHNGGTNAHYFEKINELNENDEIEYITKLGSKKYKVEKVYKISSYDWSSVVGNENSVGENTITLITCINGLPNYRLCVKGGEIK